MKEHDDDRTSPMVQSIRAALSRLRPARGLLRVSVSTTPKWEPGRDDERIFVRWCCWSIDDDGREVHAPEFVVLSPSVTCERLARDLPPLFPTVKVVVDEDIDA